MDLKPVGTRSPSFLAQAVKDVVGRPRLVRIASVLRKALLGNFEVSPGDRNLAWILRDTIPKRLQITDLLYVGKIAKPRRFGNCRVFHGWTSIQIILQTLI